MLRKKLAFVLPVMLLVVAMMASVSFAAVDHNLGKTEATAWMMRLNDLDSKNPETTIGVHKNCDFTVTFAEGGYVGYMVTDSTDDIIGIGQVTIAAGGSQVINIPLKANLKEGLYKVTFGASGNVVAPPVGYFRTYGALEPAIAAEGSGVKINTQRSDEKVTYWFNGDKYHAVTATSDGSIDLTTIPAGTTTITAKTTRGGYESVEVPYAYKGREEIVRTALKGALNGTSMTAADVAAASAIIGKATAPTADELAMFDFDSDNKITANDISLMNKQMARTTTPASLERAYRCYSKYAFTAPTANY